MAERSVPERTDRGVRLVQRYLASFHRPEKGKIYRVPGVQFPGNHFSQPVQFDPVVLLHQFPAQQGLIHPVPALQLAQRVPE